MVAYDSRRRPDPSEILRPETITALRSALLEQKTGGHEPTDAMQSAVELAAHEARTRSLPPEALLIQLKQLADEVGIESASSAFGSRGVREWLVQACLRAYSSAPDPKKDD